METLIIRVNLSDHHRNGPPQLGINIEAPYSKANLLQQQRQQRIQKGLQITQIQEGSVIDRNGQFKIGDIIVEVNGVNLQKPFAEAHKTLKEFVDNHGPLIFKVLRNETSSASTPSQRSSTSARHLIGSFNTRKIGTKHSIKLTKSGSGGFGIKIAERDNMFGANRPIYITAITTTGSAYRDGRLKEGDMLLKVNGIDLSDKSQPEVTRMLKSVPVNEAVEFLVSRQDDPHTTTDERINGHSMADSCDNNNHTSLIDLDVPNQDYHEIDHTSNHHFEKKVDSILNRPNIDEPGTHVYDIPLNDTKSAGLGLYLKYPTLDGKDLGIWIEKVITGGAAWKDGRLQTDDQILAINGISLLDLSNAEAAETLNAAVCRGIGPEATSNTIRLDILRRDPSVVAKILHGTYNRIQHSDLPTNQAYSINDKIINCTQDSYRTALDHTIHNRSQSSSNDTSCSNKSSNQNSHNDSAMSPQTQASISLKLSNSCNDKSDRNSSDKTNDTSSAISQITDFTSVPVTEHTISEEYSNNQTAFTLPKTLELTDGIHNIDLASTQSWDDESIDATTGEERFQRDGFGRQSISEKKFNAQLTAKNTDTYKRNQILREERERQRHIQDLQEKHRELENQQQLQQQQLQLQQHQQHHDQQIQLQQHQHQQQHLQQHNLSPPQQIHSSTVVTNSRAVKLFSKFLKFGSMKKKKGLSGLEEVAINNNNNNNNDKNNGKHQNDMQHGISISHGQEPADFSMQPMVNLPSQGNCQPQSQQHMQKQQQQKLHQQQQQHLKQQQQLIKQQQQQMHYAQDHNGQAKFNRQSQQLDGHPMQQQQHPLGHPYLQQQPLIMRQQQHHQMMIQQQQLQGQSLGPRLPPIWQQTNKSLPQQMNYMPINDVIAGHQQSPTHIIGGPHLMNSPQPSGMLNVQRVAPIAALGAQHMIHGYNHHQQGHMNGLMPKQPQQHYIGTPQPRQIIHSSQIQPINAQIRPHSQQIVQMQHQPQQMPRRVYRAIYNYVANDVDEVSFFENDILIDCVNVDGNWLIGKVARSGQTGMLPANYVAEFN